MIDRLQRDSGLVFEEPSGFVILLFSYGGSFFFHLCQLLFSLYTSGIWADNIPGKMDRQIEIERRKQTSNERLVAQ